MIGALARLGRPLVGAWRRASYVMAVAGASLVLACRRDSWTRATRAVFYRQILFTAIDALAVALRIGFAVGILMIVEAALWLEAIGSTTAVVAPTLLALTVRELGPLIACLIVIGRSGVTMATELANMRVMGELDALESMGIDPMTYLVMPRVISVTFTVICLAMMVVASIFVSGYVVGLFIGAIHSRPDEFFHEIFSGLQLTDLSFFLPKTLFSGLLVGTICCIEGIQVRPLATEVPRVASRSGVLALTGVFAVNAALSLVIYGRVLIFQVL